MSFSSSKECKWNENIKNENTRRDRLYGSSKNRRRTRGEFCAEFVVEEVFQKGQRGYHCEYTGVK